MLEMTFNTRQEIEGQLDDFRILFAYHSNKIENEKVSYNDVRSVFEDGKVVGYSGDLKTLFEIDNQKKCYDYFLDKIVERQKIDFDLVKDVHKLLTAGTYDENRYAKGERPGEFKKGDYIVGESEVGSSAEDVEKDMQELIDEINNVDADDILTIATYFHLRFESIHPFADGNGRTGRTLLNYFLMIYNIRPLIIYNEDKKYYYECLRAYDDKEDIEPLRKFLEYTQNKTWGKKDNTRNRSLKSFLF